MFVVPLYVAEYRLLWRDGSVLRFPSLVAAGRYAREHDLLGCYVRNTEIGDDFGPTERVFEYGVGFRWLPRAPHLVCRSEHGDVVSVDELRVAAGLRRSFRFSWWREQRPEDYRCAPVPGVHKSAGYHYFRHPQTQRELRGQVAYLDHLHEHGLNSARVGRVRDVPSAWDDIPRHVDHNWKRHRRTRYRAR